MLSRLLDCAECSDHGTYGEGPDRFIIQGGCGIGKTTIAFKIAYEIAKIGGKPLFICNREKIERNFPIFTLTHGCPEEGERQWLPEILAKISMKYVSSSAEIIKIMTSIHTSTQLPSCYVFDDFSSLMGNDRHEPQFIDRAAKLVAFVDDAMNYIDSQGIPIVGARLILTDDVFDCAYISTISTAAHAMLCIREYKYVDGNGCLQSSRGIFRRLFRLNCLRAEERVIDQLRLHGDVIIAS